MSAPDQPLGPVDRRLAFKALLGITLVLAAIVLVLTRPAREATATIEENGRIQQQATSVRRSPELSPQTRSTVDVFLNGFLEYLYGRAPASTVKDTTGAFLRSLEHQPLRVPPGMRSRSPRILAIEPAPGPSGMLAATATVSDEEDVDYRIAIVLASSQGRELVSGLEER